jgi:ABC-2 type transport system ATP-binding protein
VPRKLAAERAGALLDSLELGEFADRGPKTYSAGQRQRLCLAQALIHEPELLILDEPTANMDPTGRLAIMDRLLELARERGTTVFLSSHILPELEQIVDSLTMIDHGRIIVSGGVDQLKEQFSEHHYLLRTSANEAVLETLQRSETVEEGWLDADGFVHLVAEDGAALRREIMVAVSDAAADLDHLSEDRTSLQDIYRKTVGMDEEE